MAEKKHFLRVQDLSASEIETLFWLTRQLKRDRTEGRRRHELSGRHIALYMEKPSVRTRISFTVGVRELGGDIVELVGGQTKLGNGEHPFDFAAVISRYCHAIVARVFSDESLEQMVQGATVPVINALSDGHHPCQALADFFTLQERFRNLKGLKLAYVGDGKNNVARSLIDMSKLLGVELRVASPKGFQPPPEITEGITVTADPRQAVEGVHAIYTDTWVSMGVEAEAEVRRAAFAGFKVDESLLALALPEAVLLHCLPAVRDEEIAASLLHGPRSAILDQAENRLHTQKALLLLVENRHDRTRDHERDHGHERDRHREQDRDRSQDRNRDRRQGGQESGRPPRQREERARPAEAQGEQPQGEQPAERTEAKASAGQRERRRRRRRGRERERTSAQSSEGGDGKEPPENESHTPRDEGGTEKTGSDSHRSEAPGSEGNREAPSPEASFKVEGSETPNHGGSEG
ncbi:MAG: ornithine carbamoyltransferase [Myxococcales bacterium]|nr:ornithine carbamoyltransferase [Polyangiaceae bacterium]MDW8251477.1 ornithine carbamoyltransferase [Myxococcales bacterium]